MTADPRLFPVAPEPDADPYATEQRYIDGLYRRLTEVRAQTTARLAEVRLQRTRHHQALFERDVEAHHLEQTLARYDVGATTLCFGRLDMRDRARYYIGRLGLSDANQDVLLVDWRAPAAEPFYRATPGQPEGVALRRHLLCEGRRLIGIDDELFDAGAVDDVDRQSLRGEAALMAALQRRRTGRMGDIVATIQAEQDAIVRAALEGVLLVQGGPGTGKTAVALHRAAYLLYTHRTRLSRMGVLILGPSRVFLRYIEQVLPSLGETGAVLARVGDLLPGVTARRVESPVATRAKGRAEMATFVERAVAIRQRALRNDEHIGLGAMQLKVTPRMANAARRRARASGLPHNPAKSVFDAALLDSLVGQALSKQHGSGRQRGEVRASLRRSAEFRTLAYKLWPSLSPTEMLADLFSSRVLIRAAGRDILSDDEINALHHPLGTSGEPEGGWSPDDVPLLDEAADRLGEIAHPHGRRRRRGNDGAERSVLGDGDPWARYSVAEPTVEEAARADRTWNYGHVIVDEAQEVSPMAWRMIARRCPQLSMTVVGDWAQRSVDWGATGWADALGPVAERMTAAELTVNYRTPAEAMAVASSVLAAIEPGAEPPRSIRESGFEPWAMAVDEESLADVATGVAAHEVTSVGDGRVVVIVPRPLRASIGEAMQRGLGDVVATGDGAALDRTVSVLDVHGAKGLEFDSVVVVEPAAIYEHSARGGNDLFVALTRTTNRLGVVHSRPLPYGLSPARAVTSIDAIG